LQREFLGLSPDDSVKILSPVSYRFHLERDGEAVLTRGSCSTKVGLVCCRCGEPFEDLLEIPDWHGEFPLEKNQISVDLGEILREDMLLDLPGYPRCEESSLHPRTCPAGEFPSSGIGSGGSQGSSSGDEADQADPWKPLDQLDLPGDS
jgi:hypothetical protein